jgi:dihydrofolate reductase
MRISIIVAAAANGVIGSGNALPWRLPADLRRFKRLTMGHHLVVGRRTWDSIGRPLPGRKMIVVSRSRPQLPAGVARADSFEAAAAMARDAGEDELFVAGGAAIYALALPSAHRLYLTRVLSTVEGDVFLPPIDFEDWTLSTSDDGTVDEESLLPHRFEIWERKG